MVRWRTHAHPDIGEDPVVNRQIGASVIFLGILWNRVGTPTKRAQSGTMEEFERARDLWKKSPLRHLLLYFKTPPSHARTLEELDQMKKVAEFRTTVASSALVKEFRTVRKFQDTV